MVVVQQQQQQLLLLIIIIIIIILPHPVVVVVWSRALLFSNWIRQSSWDNLHIVGKMRLGEMGGDWGLS